MNDNERLKHVADVITLLPKSLQERIHWSHERAYLRDAALQRNVLSIVVSRGKDYDSSWSLYVRPSSYAGYKNKHWRKKVNGLFSYQKVADHVVKVEKWYIAREGRRDAGQSIAEARIKSLSTAFEQDPLLSQFNLNINAEAARHTENGTVFVRVNCKCPCGKDSDPYHDYACPLDRPEGTVRTAFDGPFRFNGKSFSGGLTIRDISIEQFIALMAVLRFDQLNLLEMIPLAGDSILGPAIREMVERTDEQQEEAA